MFGRMMNNYYYGKSGKGDFRKEDLPQNRRQLFTDTLKVRLSALCRINLLYMLIFLPAMLVIMFHFTSMLSYTSRRVMIEQSADYASYAQQFTAEDNAAETPVSEEQYNEIKNSDRNYADDLKSVLYHLLIWLIPCLAITGPFTAGLSYVTRNWARDEHAFIWSDFKDALKENWKTSLVLSVITSVIPLLVFLGWETYGQMASRNTIMIIPQVLVVMVAVIWAISITYMHPLAVSYELKTKDVIRNGLLLGVARLPMSVGIRLLHCLPVLIGALMILFWNPMYGMLIVFAYYVLIGFSLSRFVTASYTNAVFDRFINPRIEGAKVDRGLYKPDDEEEEEGTEGDAEN